MKKLMLVIFLLCFMIGMLPCMEARADATIYADDIVSIAKSLVGQYPYVSGGESPEEGGFDCTGLVYYIYHSRLGMSMTINQARSKSGLLALGTKISNKADMLPGDVIQMNYGHVMIYIGNNQIIEAAKPGTMIRQQSFSNVSSTFEYAIRFPSVRQDQNTVSVTVKTGVAKDIGKNSATLCAEAASAGDIITEIGVYIGDNLSNLSRLCSKSVNTASASVEFSTAAYKTLIPGETYCYRAYVIVSGVTYWSDNIESFSTKEADVVDVHVSPYVYSLNRASIVITASSQQGELTKLFLRFGTAKEVMADVRVEELPNPMYSTYKVWTFTDLKYGTTYYYRACAVADGEEYWSDLLSFTTGIPVEEVVVDKNKLELSVGDTALLTAFVRPNTATDWTLVAKSSDISIAVVERVDLATPGMGVLVTAASEGTATITVKAGGKSANCVVTVLPAHAHTLAHNGAIPATCIDDGNDEYWYCADCGKFFADEDAQTAISSEETVIAALGHDYRNGKCTRCGETDPDYHRGIEYRINGITLRDSAYQSISAIPRGTFYAEVSVTNLCAEATDTLVLATYDSNGKMLGMSFLYANPQIGQTFVLGTGIDNSKGEVAKIKSFMLPMLGGLTPLAESAELGI